MLFSSCSVSYRAIASESLFRRFLREIGRLHEVEIRQISARSHAGLFKRLRRLSSRDPDTSEINRMLIEQHNRDVERIDRQLDFLNKIIERKSDAYDVTFERTGSLLFDWYKHLTTLSTASILIISALVQRLFRDSDWSWLIVVALLLLLTSVLPLVFSMLGIIDKVSSHPEPRSARRENLRNYRNATTFGWVAFNLGIVSFIIFVIRNSVLC